MMYSFDAIRRSNKNAPTGAFQVHYLVLPSEPKEVTAASRGSYGYHQRYLARRRLIRTLRRLRRV